MRRRYCSTSARQLSVPARIAACTSAIDVSSTRKLLAGPACAMSDLEIAMRRSAVPRLLIVNDQRRSASAASYMRIYAERAGSTSLVVLKAAMTADVVAGLKKRNDRKPAWLPVWPRMVALPRCTTKNESAIESGAAAVSLIG